MRLVVDANVIVGVVLNPRKASAIFANPDLELVIAAPILNEARHEVSKRISLFDRLDPSARERLRLTANATLDLLTVIPQEEYASFEREARARIPDRDDWYTLALVLALGDAAVLSRDRHFHAIGIAVWNDDNLVAHLQRISG
jgi:predicted nucleic acid-binding protein